MPDIYKSPGVYFKENDFSYYARGTEEASTALITPTLKGAKLIPAKVYSFLEYDELFGSTFISGSQLVEYLGSITAKQFFDNGGTSLLVVPLGSGSYTPATSTIPSSLPSGSPAFTIETLTDGLIMNSGTSEIPGSYGALTNGSPNNIRWETTENNPTKGTFTLLVRQGDDNDKQKNILETYRNLTLDPTSSDFISERVGDVNLAFNSGGFIDRNGGFDNKSKFIRISNVAQVTPYYFDANGVAKNQFTGSLPPNMSGSFTGGSDGSVAHPMSFYDQISAANTQGYTANTNAYTNALNLLANPEEYQFDILLVPGVTSFTHPTILSKIQTIVESREDCLAIVDMVPYGYNPIDATTQAANYDSSDMATYYAGWLELPSGGKKVRVPESTVMGGVFAYSKTVGEAWFAPAGLNRGGLPAVSNVGRKLFKSDRELLYDAGVNPIEKSVADGINVMGQRTLQKRSTALDRINVRLLLIDAKRFVKTSAKKILFEQDTEVTRQKFLAEVRPYFERIQERQGLYAYRVIMDNTVNTNETIDRNMLIGVIQLKPSKTVEFIEIPFEIYPTGVDFKNP